MGRRRGQTGSGGAVVSSLSQNVGGTVKAKSDQGQIDSIGPAANPKRKPRHGTAATGVSATSSGEHCKEEPSFDGDSSSSNSYPRQTLAKSAGWLGKSPVEFLREWCTKNNRKRPW